MTYIILWFALYPNNFSDDSKKIIKLHSANIQTRVVVFVEQFTKWQQKSSVNERQFSSNDKVP